MSDFTDVGNFHRKFDLHTSDDEPGEVPVPTDLIDMRQKFLQEELDEFVEGVEEWDHGKMFDALIDLVYVALGTAHLLGYPWQRGWDLVQGANMAKVRSTGDDDPRSTRASKFDVVKPPGWTPPDIAGLLEQFGFAKCPGCNQSFLKSHCYLIGGGKDGYYCDRKGIVSAYEPLTGS